MLRAVLPLRGTDRHGSGHYGASRDGGRRAHMGVDLAAWPGTIIFPTISGTVTKLGYPYADDLTWRYVQVTDAARRDHRYFYVEPCVRVGEVVTPDSPLGAVQDLRLRYRDITPHVHYEIKTQRGYIEPQLED